MTASLFLPISRPDFDFLEAVIIKEQARLENAMKAETCVARLDELRTDYRQSQKILRELREGRYAVEMGIDCSGLEAGESQTK